MPLNFVPVNFQSASSLDFGRFCTGLGVGVFSYVVRSSFTHTVQQTVGSFRQFQLTLTLALATQQVPVFIAEIAPKALRGGLTALNPVTLFLLETKYEHTIALLAFWEQL